MDITRWTDMVLYWYVFRTWFVLTIWDTAMWHFYFLFSLILFYLYFHFLLIYFLRLFHIIFLSFVSMLYFLLFLFLMFFYPRPVPGLAPWGPRAWHSSTTYQGKLWLMGGSPLNNEVWRLDDIKKVNRTLMPLTRAM